MLIIEKKRLLKLANFLENEITDDRFDLSNIAISSTGELPSKKSCGTTACAIGYMPCVFPKYCKYSNYKYDKEYLTVSGKGQYSDLSNFLFAQCFLGITQAESSYLFEPYSYGVKKGRKTVAKRIRKFVEANGIPY
jgi:hypothetical protein